MLRAKAFRNDPECFSVWVQKTDTKERRIIVNPVRADF